MNIEFQNIIKALEKNNMQGFYAETKEEAKKIVESLMPEGASVTHGGSETIKECGITELLTSGKYNYIDRTKDPDATRKAFSADIFLTSTNAITTDGRLYNVDGNSNRVAAILYGPESVICIAGKNKIVHTIQEAADRVRSIAAPKNTQRLSCATYCREAGHCVLKDGSEIGDGCESDSRICCNFTVCGQQRYKNRIKVILVNEDLGY